MRYDGWVGAGEGGYLGAVPNGGAFPRVPVYDGDDGAGDDAVRFVEVVVDGL